MDYTLIVIKMDISTEFGRAFGMRSTKFAVVT